MNEIIRETPSDGVTLLRLNRPDKFNALSNALVERLASEFEACEADGTRAIVIAGDARAFAAGADIAEFIERPPDLAQWDRIWRGTVPTIAAVRGLALGGGLELAMSCDLIVVADDARLGLPELKLGVMPGAGGTQRLTRAVGKALASEMMFLSREISGLEALVHGLANRTVPSERVEPTALAFAQRIAFGAPHALRAAKRAIASAFEDSLRTALDAERAAIYELFTTADAREGFAAFSERRAAKWTGR